MNKIKLEGDVNDNLYVSDNSKVKVIRLVNADDATSNYSFEIVSESENSKHELIDQLLNKKISIEINVIQ